MPKQKINSVHIYSHVEIMLKYVDCINSILSILEALSLFFFISLPRTTWTTRALARTCHLWRTRWRNTTSSTVRLRLWLLTSPPAETRYIKIYQFWSLIVTRNGLCFLSSNNHETMLVHFELLVEIGYYMLKLICQSQKWQNPVMLTK